ncbi:MAG: hypothetical protein CM1200mP36_01110 [Gammaproteobacteria bacterium]|nr:MAG: hypothetical protein CM1200mP36_01110 [Gammaproteobacteria bacterium]
MLPIRNSVVCLLLPVFISVGSVSAHHSHSNYETIEFTHLQGKVTELYWINPHTWIFIEVSDAEGESMTWALEGASPVELRRDGWSEDDVQVGDTSP